MARDITTEPMTENDEDLGKRFAQLAATWKKETLHHSRMDKVAAHPAHREIVAMGERAVPLILADLEKNGGTWFMALREIIGDGPTLPTNDRGVTKKMAAAWIAWAYEQGYRWERAI